MNIPNQIPFIEIVVSYLFGFLCVFAGVLYIWNFTTFDVLNYVVNLQWAGTLLLIFLPYLIGVLFSSSLFSFSVRLSIFSVKKPLNKFQSFIGIVFFGIRQKPDSRVALLTDSYLDNIIKKKIKNIFSLDVDKLTDASKRELFYVVLRYIDNRAKGNTARLDALYTLVNILSSTTLFLLLLLAVNTIALLASFIYVLGHIPLPALIIVEIITLTLIRYMAAYFQSTLLAWWKNIWRSFIVIEGEAPVKRKLRGL